MTNQHLHSIAWVLNRLPRSWTLALGRLLGAALCLCLPYRKDVAWTNLSLALPERSRRQRWAILRRTYQHFGMVLMDFIRLPAIAARPPEEIVAMQDDTLRQIRRAGENVIMMTGHIGNWELIPLVVVNAGIPIVSIAVTQRGGGGSFVERVREDAGSRIVPKNTPIRNVLRLFREGNILGLVADQDARRQGIWVRFLERPSSRFKGGGLLHLHTGAPLIFTVCLLGRDGRYRLSLAPIETEHLSEDREEAIRVLTQRFFDYLSVVIRQHPEQYFWFHRMWKTRPVTS